ncbi:MAG TPA: Ig-like domain-containing protein [Candidatus Micrarchaeia archaeon]|nr:Ig-like domain-containing protein [Candidatus Micrarchaeia archaeon]
MNWPWAARRREQREGSTVDPDLLAIFPADDDDPELLQFAQHLRSLRPHRPGELPDAAFQQGLRSRLLAEARQRRARRLDIGVRLGVGLGMAGLAMVALVAIAIAIFPPAAGPVLAQSRQAGSHALAPTQAIELSFNRPMAEAAVEAGLRIRPAVPFTTTWTDPEHLTIHPRHALAQDVSYVVTIARTSARAANGAEAARSIVIPFGTAAAKPTPARTAIGPRVTRVVELARADGATALLKGPGGMLYVSATGTLVPAGARTIRRLPLAVRSVATLGAGAIGNSLGALRPRRASATPSPTASPSAAVSPSPASTPSPPASLAPGATPSASSLPGAGTAGRAVVAASPSPSPGTTATPTAPIVPTPTSLAPTATALPTASPSPTPTGAGVPVLSAGPGALATPSVSAGVTPNPGGTIAAVPSPSSTSSPSPSARVRPLAPSIGQPGPAATVFRLSPDGRTSVPLLRGVHGVTLSPDGTSVAGWAVAAGGSQVLEVANTAGVRSAEVLTHSPLADPTATWLDDGHLLVSTAEGLVSIGLDRHVAPVDVGVRLGHEGYFRLAPSGLDLYSVPGGRPTVTNLTTLTTVRLPGLVAGPVWSPDGAHLAYVTAAGGVETLDRANADGSDPAPLFAGARGARIAHLAFSPGGQFVAFTVTRPGGAPELTVAGTASGAVTTLSARPGIVDPVWSATGSAIAALELGPTGVAGAVLTFELSDVGAVGTSPQGLAAAAASTLAQAQVTGPRAAGLAARVLAASARVPAAALFPGRFNRAYILSTTPLATSAGAYGVDVHLIRDATATQPTEYLQEQLTVQVAGQRARVLAVTASVMEPVPSGPTVMQTQVVSGADGTTVFRLQFDADLDPATVSAHAVSLTVGNTVVTGLQLAYSPSTRTLSVSAGPIPAGAITLTVGAPLADVDHTPMGAPFHLALPATLPSLEAAPPS